MVGGDGGSGLLSGDNGKDASEMAIANAKFVREERLRKTRVRFGTGIKIGSGTANSPEWAGRIGAIMLMLFLVLQACGFSRPADT
jgi:hypothetical protein